MAGRGNRPLFLIDIAVPRDIDAEVDQLDNVYLYNVDHLEAIVRENVRHREQELARCQAILTERTAAIMARFTTAPEKPFHPGVPSEPAWALDAVGGLPRLIRGTQSMQLNAKTLLTREPGSELAAGPNSRRKTRHPVDDALNLAASS